MLVMICTKRAGVTPITFWAALGRKSGVAPARFGGFFTVTFVRIALLSPTLQRNCSGHRLKNLEETQLKHVVLTFFTPSLLVPLQEPRPGAALRLRTAP